MLVRQNPTGNFSANGSKRPYNESRNRRSSTAVITNVNFDNWTEYLGDPPMTMALLDRVVDQTNLIKFEGESIRADALRKLKKAANA